MQRDRSADDASAEHDRIGACHGNALPAAPPDWRPARYSDAAGKPPAGRAPSSRASAQIVARLWPVAGVRNCDWMRMSCSSRFWLLPVLPPEALEPPDE